MKQDVANFLEFKGKNLLFTTINGTTYVAIKPVCEAVNVDYTQQFKNINADSILGPALCKHTMQVPGEQVRNYACLPERYVYGWIFSIKSKSAELLEYKKECYDILYNHFHGVLTKRKTLLQDKVASKVELEQLKKRLRENPDYLRAEELQGEIMRIGKNLKDMDSTVEAEQMSLFSDFK